MESLDTVPPYVFERDPRLRTWISAQPLSLASIVGAYLYVVYIWGPRFMRDRKPYQLTGITRTYNLFQIIASTAFAFKIAHHFYGKMDQPFLCSPPDNRRTDALTMELLDMTFYYWWVSRWYATDCIIYYIYIRFGFLNSVLGWLGWSCRWERNVSLSTLLLHKYL